MAWIDDLDEDRLGEIQLAARAYEHLLSGGQLQPIPTPADAPVEPGESVYSDSPLEYARHDRADGLTTAPEPRPPSDPVPSSSGRSRVGSAARTWRIRRQTGPPWRDLSLRRVVVTDQRLLIEADGSWLTLRYDAVAEFAPVLPDRAFIVRFHDADPLRLRGPDAPRLAVVVASFLYPLDDVAALPGFAVFTEPPED